MSWPALDVRRLALWRALLTAPCVVCNSLHSAAGIARRRFDTESAAVCCVCCSPTRPRWLLATPRVEWAAGAAQSCTLREWQQQR